MSRGAILLTIEPRFAEAILNGTKLFEYRKHPPKITEPARTILYTSGERQLAGEFTMEPVSGPQASIGFPLPVRDPVRYAEPLPWQSVEQRISGIRRPQRSFRYLDSAISADRRLLRMLASRRSGRRQSGR